MNNLKTALFVCLSLFAVWACKEEELTQQPEKPSLKIVGKNFSVSMENVKVYLTNAQTITHTSSRIIFYRTYTVSDGTLRANADPLLPESYQDGTFLITVLLGTFSEVFEPGSFQQAQGWNTLPVDNNYGIITFLQGTGNNSIEITTNQTRNEFFVISNGVNDNETITFAFNGTLSYSRFDQPSNQFISTDENVIINFEASIEDVRPAPL